MYNAYITKLKNVRPHPNADRMLLADCFGNTVCVGLDAQEGDVIIYFPTDGQLSKEYAEINNLVRIKNEDGTYSGGYLDPDKRNIKAIKLRGEKSDGLTMPLSSLDAFGDTSTLKVGDVINVFNGHEICCKYIPRTNPQRVAREGGNRTRKKKVNIAPLFKEHVDTEQLAYNLDAFKLGDEIEITLKMHGTSQRTGYLPKLVGYKKSLLDKIFRREGTPIYEWGYVTGTRRTVIDDFENRVTSFYGSDAFRGPHAARLEGKLWKGETVYYEVVGFTDSGKPIMGDCDNKKTNDKEFIKQYGQTTTFSYGCEPDGDPSGIDMNGNAYSPQSAMYVYRMNMINEDGNVVEYTPDFMRYRCEQMGVEWVPDLWKGILIDDVLDKSAGECVKEFAEEFYDGPDPIGKTHVREGVVVRILNRPKFAAYKHKNFYFKVLEGIIKADALAPDIEEAQELESDEL